MNTLNDYPVESRVKIFLVTEISYEGIIACHYPYSHNRPSILVIEDGNKKKRTFALFEKLDGTKGWALILNNSSSNFAFGQEEPIHFISRVEVPEGTKRFSFVECTCPEREKEKHGHVFDEVEGKNSPSIFCPKNAEDYFYFLKARGRILGNDSRDIDDVMNEINNYFN